jgi:hypothetical protein
MKQRPLQVATAVLALIPVVNSNLRFFGGVWLGLGLAMLWLVPSIERHGILFRALWGAIFLGGAGRLLPARPIHGGARDELQRELWPPVGTRDLRQLGRRSSRWWMDRRIVRARRPRPQLKRSAVGPHTSLLAEGVRGLAALLWTGGLDPGSRRALRRGRGARARDSAPPSPVTRTLAAPTWGALARVHCLHLGHTGVGRTARSLDQPHDGLAGATPSTAVEVLARAVGCCTALPRCGLVA